MTSIREWARSLKRQTLTLYYAVRDPRTPWSAKLVAGCVVAYAISPIDLIPDFIPVLGYLDELIVLPAGIWLALKVIPDDILDAARQKADMASERPTSNVAAAIIVLIWITAVIVLGRWAYREWMSS
jgi:uncharacterized membrane protein YkvA (DUF1232 family)